MSDFRFIKALRREPIDSLPIWLMRQAGRYLPEYQKIRQQAGGFMALCQTPELACEVTLQPLARFDLDAAIIFSDILVIPDAMGCDVTFTVGEGPKILKPVRNKNDIERLILSDPRETLGYVMQAIELVKHELTGRTPLIGFSGSPWTLACYMVEGQGSREFSLIKPWMHREPQDMHILLKKITHMVTEYMLAQAQAGVDVLMLFDTWGGILDTSSYFDFSLRYMRQVVQAIKARYPTLPVICFTKGGGQWLDAMAGLGCDALGLDWTMHLGEAQKLVGDRVALQGNLDPLILLSSQPGIERAVTTLLNQRLTHIGHVFNLGHGVLKTTPPEHVAYLIELIRQHGLFAAR